jgi:hypothetical protein
MSHPFLFKKMLKQKEKGDLGVEGERCAKEIKSDKVVM